MNTTTTQYCTADQHKIHKGTLRFFASLQWSRTMSSVLVYKVSGVSMPVRISWGRVCSPILLLSLVLINFIPLKVCSTVAVVTGITFKIQANLARFGNAASIPLLPSNRNSTCCKELPLCFTKITRLKSFHSYSVSSGSMSGCDTTSIWLSWILCSGL